MCLVLAVYIYDTIPSDHMAASQWHIFQYIVVGSQQERRKITCVGKRKEFAVAVEVLGASAFFITVVVSPSSGLLSEASTPTPDD
jgi:hypothetical protein